MREVGGGETRVKLEYEVDHDVVGLESALKALGGGGSEGDSGSRG